MRLEFQPSKIHSSKWQVVGTDGSLDEFFTNGIFFRRYEIPIVQCSGSLRNRLHSIRASLRISNSYKLCEAIRIRLSNKEMKGAVFVNFEVRLTQFDT